MKPEFIRTVRLYAAYTTHLGAAVEGHDQKVNQHTRLLFDNRTYNKFVATIIEAGSWWREFASKVTDVLMTQLL